MKYSLNLSGWLLRLAVVCGLAVLVALPSWEGVLVPSAHAAAPYPRSRVITKVTWYPGSLTRQARGSDIFPLTWASNGDLYTAWGDGWGFQNRSAPKASLGVSRVSGNPPAYSGTDLWEGVVTGKSHGILAVGGNLYMIVQEQGKWLRAKVGRSTDQGYTWTFPRGWHFEEPGGAFAGACFLQFGRNYQGARDSYVYGYDVKVQDVVGMQPHIVLFRVPKGKIMNRSAYRFFAGRDSEGNPRWTVDITRMKPVFSHPTGEVQWGTQAMYHPVFKRYLLTVGHNESGGWGIYEAPEPWGPWRTVAYYEDGWLDSLNKFAFSFSQKWMSTDGKTMWMVFSGLKQYDAFNVIKVKFE